MIKCGIDLVLNRRIKINLNNPDFLRRIFTLKELKQNKKSKLTGIFALKEATMKAFGEKLPWHSIEVLAKEGKKPLITLQDKKFKSLDASISHDGDYTIGMVVIDV